jgi:hypothetical protein
LACPKEPEDINNSLGAASGSAWAFPLPFLSPAIAAAAAADEDEMNEGAISWQLQLYRNSASPAATLHKNASIVLDATHQPLASHCSKLIVNTPWKKNEAMRIYGVVYATRPAAMTMPNAKNNTILTIWTIWQNNMTGTRQSTMDARKP